jgi:hypothetical protein
MSVEDVAEFDEEMYKELVENIEFNSPTHFLFELKSRGRAEGERNLNKIVNFNKVI